MKSAVFIIIALLAGYFCGFLMAFRRRSLAVIRQQELINKERIKSELLNRWLWRKIQKKRLDEQLLDLGYSKIAVYGMDSIGQRLCEDLSNGTVTVVYGVDKRAAAINSSIPVYEPEESLPETEAVIVTAEYYYESVKSDLKKRIDVPILSLYELLKSECGES